MQVEFTVPYWGSPELMLETCASVLAQEDPEWSMLVVDDGYPDPRVREHLERLADPRVRYLRNPHNLGVSGNFERCLELATGDLVVFLGSDDVLEPGYVGQVKEAAAQFPASAIIQPGVLVIDGEGRASLPLADRVKQRLVQPRTNGRALLEGERLAVSLMIGDWLYWPSLAFRREVVQRFSFRAEYEVVLDLALVIELVLAGESLVVDPAPVFRYRRHEDSVSSVARSTTRFEDERAYFAEAAARFEARGWPRAARAARGHLTSRLHALTMLPGALGPGRRDLRRELVRHAFS